jgi:hypothetical protein
MAHLAWEGSTRLMPVTRMMWGGLLAGAPGLVLGTVTGRPPVRSQKRLLRVLGTRHLLQGSLDLARPTPALLRAGAVVDLLHAATCAGAVAFLPAWGRVALLDGTGAIGFAAGGLLRSRSARGRTTHAAALIAERLFHRAAPRKRG